MDSLTHVVLGACIAEALAGKSGKRVLVAGAVAQSLPDIDFVASIWLDPASDLLAHRGFTHSFLFVALAAPALALVTNRYLIPGTLALRKWIFFYLAQVFIHVFLDAFNVYGTGWFEPFSHTRVSFNTLFVADPFFTLPLVVASVFLFLSSSLNSRRWKLTLAAIFWCCFYLAMALYSKASINRAVEANFGRQGIVVKNYLTTPTPLNSWLWYIVANTDSGSYVGYRSIFVPEDSIVFEFFSRSEELLEPVAGFKELELLKRFSEGYYIADRWGDTLVFNDLRFGQMIGWRDRRAHFVFHYYLSHPNDNDLVVQRGRFAGWDGNAVRSLFESTFIGRELPGENRK